MKKTALTAALTLLVGCSTAYHESTEYDLESYDTLSALNDGLRAKDYPYFNVAVRAGKASGMGVPLSDTHIATVAHVVDNVAVGGTVDVFHIYNKNLKFSATVVDYSEDGETAVLEVAEKHNFPVPKICDNSFGGQRVQGERPSHFGYPRTGSQGFYGLVTNVTRLPMVTDVLEQDIVSRGGPSTQAMAGKSRVIVATNGQTTGGNSGGAIIDIDQRCVLGIASMNARVSNFKEPESLMKDIGYQQDYIPGAAPYLLVGIPMSHFSKWMP